MRLLINTCLSLLTQELHQKPSSDPHIAKTITFCL
jgi:hypothetical protein